MSNRKSTNLSQSRSHCPMSFVSFLGFFPLGFVCSILLVDPLSTFSPTLNFGDLPQWVQQESTSGCDRIAVKQQEWTQWTEEFDPVSSSISNTHQIHPIWWGDLIHVETIKKRKVKSLPLHGRFILIFASWFVSRFFFCFLYLSTSDVKCLPAFLPVFNPVADAKGI